MGTLIQHEAIITASDTALCGQTSGHDEQWLGKPGSGQYPRRQPNAPIL